MPRHIPALLYMSRNLHFLTRCGIMSHIPIMTPWPISRWFSYAL